MVSKALTGGVLNLFGGAAIDAADLLFLFCAGECAYLDCVRDRLTL